MIESNRGTKLVLYRRSIFSHLNLWLHLSESYLSGGRLRLSASDLAWFILKFEINPNVLKFFVRLGIEICGWVIKNSKSSA